jgi:PhzF family phenazine biosynthesis protein
MKLNTYVVDAFTNKLFGGNPAAVCPLDSWLPDVTMQKLAAENNLAETAFIVNENGTYRIRWFTPAVEVKLCGHATLASAHIFYTELGYSNNTLAFQSLSGVLKVYYKAEGVYTLDFPVDTPERVEYVPAGLLPALGLQAGEVFKTAFDYMVVVPGQKDVELVNPDFKELTKVGGRGVIVTAKGDETDFVSRFFAPQSGIDEDPVTGSAHTALVPYWANQLQKNTLKAEQLSKRRGYLDCELQGNRVLMSGSAVTYLRGEIIIPG